MKWIKNSAACFAGLLAANFGYQALAGTHEWARAAERSWFQGVALIAWGLFFARR